MEGIMVQRNFLEDNKSDMECYRVIEEGSYDNESEPMVCYKILEEVPNVEIVEVPFVTDIKERKGTPELEHEVLRFCPLCQSEIKYFFINFDEKLLMCGNSECEFPFSVNNYQYKTNDVNPYNFRPEFPNSVDSCSPQLGVKINDVAPKDRYIRQYAAPKRVKQKSMKQKMLTIKKLEIKKDLEDMEKRNRKLRENEKRKNFISNQKWIHKLKNMRSASGVVLLQPEELKSVSDKKDNEVMLDIEQGEDNVCSIKVLVAPSSPSNA